MIAEKLSVPSFVSPVGQTLMSQLEREGLCCSTPRQYAATSSCSAATPNRSASRRRWLLTPSFQIFGTLLALRKTVGAMQRSRGGTGVSTSTEVKTMKQSKHTRRFFNLVAFAGVVAQAQQKAVKLGITLPLTGADADDAGKIQHGFQIAIDEANAKGGVGGYKIEVVTYDSGTATAGQYDPAQAATNTKKLISDPMIVANLGPEMSGEGKAMTPILSEADLATITPSSTNPDITSPAMAAQFKPKGRAIYFRTVTTDAFQGPNMANFYAQTLKVKSD